MDNFRSQGGMAAINVKSLLRSGHEPVTGTASFSLISVLLMLWVTVPHSLIAPWSYKIRSPRVVTAQIV